MKIDFKFPFSALMLNSPLPSGSIVSVSRSGSIVSVRRSLTPQRQPTCQACKDMRVRLDEQEQMIMELKGRLATAQAIANLSYHTTPFASPQFSAVKLIN